MMKDPKRLTELPLQSEGDRQTPEQWQATYQEGDNLLVAASAGSGKTRVLVERILQKLKRGYQLLDFLVVTFTELAASEMKDRIEAEVKMTINQATDEDLRRHLTVQLGQVSQAHISTIDAFCRQVIQRFYYLIEMDPNYRLVTDVTENFLIKDEVWQRLKEERLASNDEAYLLVAENFSDGRSDDGIDQLIFDLYDKARSHADPKAWLESLLAYYQTADSYDQSPLFQEAVKPEIRRQLADIKARLIRIDNDLPRQLAPGFEKMSEAGLQLQIKQVSSLVEGLEQMTYQDLFESFQSRPWPSLPRRSKKDFEDDDEIYALSASYKVRVDQVKADYEKLQADWLAFSDQSQKWMLDQSGNLAQALVETVIAFIDAMAAYRDQENVLDFAEIELRAYAILTSNGAENEARAYYQERFSEIMVDEYQDVNELQDAILTTMSRQGYDNNMFMVGDVKQSIYRFRFAEPGLFVGKYKAYAEGEGGQRIDLLKNFRSRHDVLHLTNYIFRQLMADDIGQVLYDDQAQLITGYTAYPDQAQMIPELLIFDSQDLDQVEDELEDSDAGQAELIAQRIQTMIESGFPIYDKALGEERPIRYDDIVILSPTRKHHLQVEEVFKRYQIPLALDKLTNYFKRTEIMIMVNLLKIIDNPYQDIPLVSVLRSAIVGLDEVDLAKIRLVDKSVHYYEALLAYMETADRRTSLFKKVQHFMVSLEAWREYSRQQAIAALIWRIYQDTAFLSYVAAMPNGIQRQSNLHGFYKQAEQFEAKQFRGLFQFIRFIEMIYERDNDLESPQLVDPEQNVVQLMTVHASKGLEFPVVFYLNLSKGFNRQDFQANVIVNDKVGLGLKVNDRQEQISYTSALHKMAGLEAKEESLAEEMRKLYVAFTRAEQKLILVASVDDGEKALASWSHAAAGEERLAKSYRLGARSPLDWIGPAIVRHPDVQKDFKGSLEGAESLAPKDPFHIKLAFVNGEDLVRDRDHFLHGGREKERVSDEQARANQVLLVPEADYHYPYHLATQTASYQSVSELKRLLQEPLDHELAVWEDGQVRPRKPARRYVNPDWERPHFIQREEQADPRAIGSAAHLLMQWLPLDQSPSAQAFEALFDRLVDQGALEASLKAELDFDRLAAFYETDTGRWLLSKKDQLYREKSFSLLMPAKEIFYDLEASDKLLIHGTIDAFVVLEDSIVLYDFKTDRLAYLSMDQQAERFAERYQVQMDIYARALENIYQKPVQDKWIIALENLKTFSLK
ncbi:helicase-exonuclease AddAB subunit AddA [Aerococcus sanguinicola]|uniref:helicase-exonuclease AddAB subunit AddA n=1 Tax=Aerococcus sanguinicola TaxID=119206 RepID=UPI002550FE39|nr:helicase-exonuclease AddAB subunit AddA [Aerococcus sanguinicola]MDK7050917.1 helicase-exonuclease AddAB subunit AddA [Aerococcus sanguinicola]